MSAPALEIPVVDVSAARAGDDDAISWVGAEIAAALETVGFFYLVGHGTDWSLVDEARTQGFRFFNSSPELKHAVAAQRLDDAGYRQVGELAYPEEGAPPSRNEAWAMYPEGSSKNRWPELPDFREALTLYEAATLQVLSSLLVPMARPLGIPDDYFTSRFGAPTRGLVLRYYPVCEYEPNQWGLGAHADQGFLTLLPDNVVPGLSVRTGPDTWIDAPSVPESFLVNSGSMLRRWTNDRFLSTEHRVLNTSGVERIAMPVFFAPSPGTEIAPLPSCVSDANPARYEPFVYDIRAADEQETAEGIRAVTRPRAHVNYEASGEHTPDAIPVSQR